MSTGFDVIIPHKLSFNTIEKGIEQFEAILDEPIYIIELKRLPGTSLATNHFDYTPIDNCKGYYINFIIPDYPLYEEYTNNGYISIDHNDDDKIEFNLGKRYLQLWHSTNMHYWDAWQSIIETSSLFKGTQELSQPQLIASGVSEMVRFYADFAKSKGFNRIYLIKENHPDLHIGDNTGCQEITEQEFLNNIKKQGIPLVDFAKPIPKLDTSNLYELSPVLFLDIV